MAYTRKYRSINKGKHVAKNITSSRKKTMKGGFVMKERIVKFEPGPRDKKYTATIMNKNTKEIRKLHFGHKDYPQFRDSTPLKLYANRNHGEIRRMRNYFNRHSGTRKRGEAILKEKKASNGFYTPKLLSHISLW